MAVVSTEQNGPQPGPTRAPRRTRPPRQVLAPRFYGQIKEGYFGLGRGLSAHPSDRLRKMKSTE